MTYLETSLLTIALPFFERTVAITPRLVLEFFLTCLSFTVVVKTTQEKRYSWLLNILKKTLGLCIYYVRGLYIKCTLDVLLMGNSLYGWYQWGQEGKKRRRPKEVTTLSVSMFLSYYVLGIAGAVVLGFVYDRYLQADKPYMDGLHATMSLLNYYLLARKKREAWLFCLTGQIVYIYVCYEKGMLFLWKYILYSLLSMRGFWRWHQAYKQQGVQADASQ